MIRADIVKLYKAVHTWIGISCGFALFIAFYAGALTMFQEPIARWASPPAVGVAAVPLDDAPRLLELVAAAHPEARKEGITLHLRGHENEPARVTWEEDAPHQEGEPHEHIHWWATLKPDGTLLAKQEEPSELAEFINGIHMRVGIPTPWGSYLMGVVSLLYGVALIAGVIVLLPSLVKDFLALRVGKNLKRMWQDAHNVVGITALPFHLVIAVTSTAWGFGGPLWSAQESVIFGGRQQVVMKRDFERWLPPRPTGDADVMMPPAQLLQRLNAQVPDFEPKVMIFKNFGDKAAAVKFVGAERGYVGDTSFGGVMLSAVTGNLVNDRARPSRQDPDRRASTTIFALHTGEYGGVTITWAYFFLGFSGAWLFYSGNLLWIETRRKKARKGGEVEQSRSTRLLGSATVGVCLGCVAGISLTIVAAKWLHGRVADLNAWHAYIYYAVFLGSVTWAFAWGAARAAVHLLWLCAAFTVAIPLTTLLAWTFPVLGMWAHGSAATIGVDVVAFIGAFCFAWMAIATTRRIRSGPADSIWSIRKGDEAALGRMPIRKIARVVLASLLMFASVSGSLRAQEQQPQQQPAAAPQPPAVSAPPAPTADPAPAPPASAAPGEPLSGVPAAGPSTEPPATTAPATLPHDLSPWGMFMQADIVVKAVMVGLGFASLVTWTVWFAKALELAGAKRKARSAARKLQRADSLAEATTAIEAGWTRSGPAADLVQAAARELKRSPDLSAEGVKERLAIALSRIEAAAGRSMTRGTGLLATIGATAPFVGLFGTVWGIMNSFIGISQAKTTNLAVVAPGIAEALLATAIGLVAAIPAVIIYNVFARAIAGYRALLSDASGEILQHLSRDLERSERAHGVNPPSQPATVHPAVQERTASADRRPRAATPLRSAE